MKALVRGKDVLTDDMSVRSIDWNTGHPLTNPDWAGGPYILIHDYTPPIDDESDSQTVVDTSAVCEPETVIIDGVEYRRA